MFDRFRRRRSERPDRGDATGEEESVDELAARAQELSFVLGRAPIEDARIAAIERLTELRADGKISEEAFVREKRRLQEYG